MRSTLSPGRGAAQLAVVGLVSLDRVDGGPPQLGGAPYYAARALHTLGHRAVVASKLGPRERRELAGLGLGVVSRAARQTIAFRIDNRGEEPRRLELERPGDPWTPADARGWLAPLLRHVRLLHAGALTRADFPAETLAELGHGRVLSLDGQGLVRPARGGVVVLDADYDPDVLRHVGILKLAEEELEALGLGLDERALASLGVPEVVVTLGPRGSVVYADGLAELVPARAVRVADPTGAGDAFMAVYLSFRLRGHGPPSAARCASDAVRALLR